MSTELLQHYVETIDTMDSVDDITHWIIGIGKTVAVENTKSLRNKSNYISGCQNPVWLSGAHVNNQHWIFCADSDSLYVKGIAKIVTDTYNKLASEEVLDVSLHDFKQITQKLPLRRQRGVQQIINRIRYLVQQH